MTQELKIKATIIDIEPKIDKNFNPFYKIILKGGSNRFYAFSNDLSEKTLTTLKENPEQLVNQLALISYLELPNKENSGTFCKVKEIQVL